MSRIIAGSARGLRLATPSGERTRPTTDRVKEAFFSGLAAWNGTSDRPADEHLADLAFLDLFAGSGGVGLEAASRGAGPVVLVEHDQPTARIIKQNAQKAKLQVEVINSGVDTWLRGTDRQLDVVWLDPPYALSNTSLASTIELAMEHLVHNGVVVVERSTRDGEPEFPEGTEHWSRSYGETVLHWCQRAAGDPGDESADDRPTDETADDQTANDQIADDQSGQDQAPHEGEDE